MAYVRKGYGYSRSRYARGFGDFPAGFPGAIEGPPIPTGTPCGDGTVMDQYGVCGGATAPLPCWDVATASFGPCPVSGTSQTNPPGTTGPYGTPGAAFSAWLAQNSTLVFGLGAAILALMLVGGRGR